MPVTPLHLLAVALGGALGALLRYGLSLGVRLSLGGAPLCATLAANGLGALLLGVLVGYAARNTALNATPLLLFLTTGFCGGFTTFSTYSMETLALLRAGLWREALAYALGSLLLGLGAAALGFWWGKG